MRDMKIVIVGGVAGGATAAARARRLDEKAEIVVFDKGYYVSFANCGLPYHVGDVIPDENDLLLMSPDSFRSRFNIDVRVRHEVVSIDRKAKQIEVKSLSTGDSFKEPYDKLIIATGSRPSLPPVLGIDSPGIRTLWTIDDLEAIVSSVKSGAKRAAVVGAGFIGLELAENLRAKGLAVTLIEALPQVLPSLDPEMAQPLSEELRFNGVDLWLKTQVFDIQRSPDGTFTILFKDIATLTVDLLAICAGVKPNSDIAKAAGLEIGSRGGIVVDNALRTSDPDIFAVGDVVESHDIVLGAPSTIPLAGPANKQARIAAGNALGGNGVYNGNQGTSILKLFSLNAASTGSNERQLKQAGVSFIKVYLHPFSHVTYYPNATQMTIKALFGSRDGRLLGAQIVGRDGVDKRIDVLAAALRQGLDATAIAALELSYAPPFGAPKDPVNLAALIAENALSGLSQLVYPDSMPENVFLLDVREPEEFSLGAIPGAVNIPLNSLRGRLAALPKDKTIVCYCKVGQRAYNAERILKGNGFDARNLSGGYLTWLLFNPPPPAKLPPPPAPTPSTTQIASQTPQANPALPSVPPLPPAAALAQQATATPVLKSLDARWLQCPGPIVAVGKEIAALSPGDVLSISASDDSFLRDLPSWCQSTGNALLSLGRNGSVIEAKVRKGLNAPAQTPDALQQQPLAVSSLPAAPVKRATIVLFSNDLDKAMAAFIIATGFASLGSEVNIFCTFWGLNVLRKDSPPKVRKDFLSGMFGSMMPRGARKLALSKMHMLGAGTAMMKYVMANKNVNDLPTLIWQARGLGVKLLACEMAMNVMGIQKEELLDGVELAGVANFAGIAEKGGPTLFI